MSPEQLLGSVESTGRTVVADFEAGIGTLTRVVEGAIDAVVIVVEPMVKSIEVAIRALDLARERKIERTIVVVNRVRDDEDLARVRDALGEVETVVVADDPAIRDADREGVAPLDHDPGAPAVRTLVELAERLAAAAPDA
jgi:CO dehydrogenase maturation factor